MTGAAEMQMSRPMESVSPSHRNFQAGPLDVTIFISTSKQIRCLDCCVIVAPVGISGSTKLDDFVKIGG